MQTLSPDVLEALRQFNTPTISNAIELFNVRPRHVGFLPHDIRCLLPDLGVMVGYAVTSQTRAEPRASRPVAHCRRAGGSRALCPGA